MYQYACDACGALTETQRPYAERERSQTCGGCGQAAAYQICAPHVQMHDRRVHPNKRAIFSEKEVEAEYGKEWRKEGTTRKEGGAGRRTYFV